MLDYDYFEGWSKVNRSKKRDMAAYPTVLVWSDDLSIVSMLMKAMQVGSK